MPDKEEPSLRAIFMKVAKPVGLLLASVPLAGALIAGMGYAVMPPVDAADKYIDIAQTDYSKRLESLRLEYARKSHDKLQIALIDPDEFHLMTALGKSPAAAVSILTRHQGITLDSGQVEGVVDQSGKFMRYFDQKLADKLGAPLRTGFAPMAQMNQAGDTCVYLPYEFRSDLLGQPKGWTPYDVAEFASRHELTHCLDAAYRDEEHKAQSPGARFSAAMKREMLADVAAFGEMIAGGRDPKLIDGILLERRTARDEHFVVGGLLDLRARLSFGGLVAFRAMNEQQRDRFYHDIVDRNGLDAENGAAFQKLERGSISMAAVRRDPHLAAAARLYAERLPEGYAISPTYSKAEVADILAYDPLQSLKGAGDIAAAVQRRAQMLDELRQQPSSDKVYLAKLEKLNQAFESQVQPVKTLPRYAALKNNPPKTL